MATTRLTVTEAIARFQQMRMDVPKALNAAAKALCIDVQTNALRNLNNDVLHRRTGTAMRFASAKLRPMRTSKGWAIGLPAGELQSRIMRLHETGGTIKAKNGKFLRIPIPGGPASKNDPYAGMSIRGVPGFFIAKSAQGNPIIFKVGTFDFSKKGSAFVPWYFLKQSVFMPSRPWFSEAVKTALDNLPNRVSDIIAKAVEGRGIPE